jgi:hypothetical protein
MNCIPARYGAIVIASTLTIAVADAQMQPRARSGRPVRRDARAAERHHGRSRYRSGDDALISGAAASIIHADW